MFKFSYQNLVEEINPAIREKRQFLFGDEHYGTFGLSGLWGREKTEQLFNQLQL